MADVFKELDLGSSGDVFSKGKKKKSLDSPGMPQQAVKPTAANPAPWETKAPAQGKEAGFSPDPQLDDLGQFKKNLDDSEQRREDLESLAEQQGEQKKQLVKNVHKYSQGIPGFATSYDPEEDDGPDNDPDAFMQELDDHVVMAEKLAKRPDGMFDLFTREDEKADAARKYFKENPNYRKQYDQVKSKYMDLSMKKGLTDMSATSVKAQEVAMKESAFGLSPSVWRAVDDYEKKKKSFGSGRGRGGDISNRGELDAFLDIYAPHFENPIYDGTGRLINPNNVDPRVTPYNIQDATGRMANKSSRATLVRRLEAARQKNVAGFMEHLQESERMEGLAKKGMFLTQNGLYNGLPMATPANERALFDIEKAKALGLSHYKGKPIEQMWTEMGGDEGMEKAKIMRGLFEAHTAYRSAHLQWIKNLPQPGSSPDTWEKYSQSHVMAKQLKDQAMQAALEAGFAKDVMERSEDGHMFHDLMNSMKRGWNQGQQALVLEEMGSFGAMGIDVMMGKVPMTVNHAENMVNLMQEAERHGVSDESKRYYEDIQNNKPEGWLDATLQLFRHPQAAGELFLQSMAALLPPFFSFGWKNAAAGAITTTLAGAGPLPGAAFALRTTAGPVSGALAFQQKFLEEFEKMGLDTNNPRDLMEAWNNPHIMDRVLPKSQKYALGVGGMDMLAGHMAGRVGKLLEGPTRHIGTTTMKGMPKRAAMLRTSIKAGGEMVAGGTAGMAGEYWGQKWSNDPGEELRWEEIAPEFWLEAGSGTVGAMYHIMKDIGGSNNIPSGTVEDTGTDTKIPGATLHSVSDGSTKYDTFSGANAGALGAKLGAEYEKQIGTAIDPEEMQGVQEFLDILFQGRNAAQYAGELKIAFTEDRDTGSTGKGHGYNTLGKDRTPVIFLHKGQLQKAGKGELLSALIHESGHFAHDFYFGDDEVMKFWENVDHSSKRRLAIRYATTEQAHDEATLNELYQKLSPDEIADMKGRVEALYGDDMTLRREWFATQVARVAGGQTQGMESGIIKIIEEFLDHIRKLVLRMLGSTEELGSNNQAVVDQWIAERIGMDPGRSIEASRAPGDVTEGERAPLTAVEGMEAVEEAQLRPGGPEGPVDQAVAAAQDMGRRTQWEPDVPKEKPKAPKKPKPKPKKPDDKKPDEPDKPDEPKPEGPTPEGPTPEGPTPEGPTPEGPISPEQDVTFEQWEEMANAWGDKDYASYDNDFENTSPKTIFELEIAKGTPLAGIARIYFSNPTVTKTQAYNAFETARKAFNKTGTPAPDTDTDTDTTKYHTPGYTPGTADMAAPVGQTGTRYDLQQVAERDDVDLTALGRVEYANYAIHHNVIIDDGALRMLPELRTAKNWKEHKAREEALEKGLSDTESLNRQSYEKEVKKWADGKRWVVSKSNDSQYGTWFHFHVNEGTKGASKRPKIFKAYVGFKNSTTSLLTHRVKAFLDKLADKGYNGQVKTVRDSSKPIIDQLVMHGQTKLDAEMAQAVAKEFFGDEISFEDFGYDLSDPSESYSQWLYDKIISRETIHVDLTEDLEGEVAWQAAIDETLSESPDASPASQQAEALGRIKNLFKDTKEWDAIKKEARAFVQKQFAGRKTGAPGAPPEVGMAAGWETSEQDQATAEYIKGMAHADEHGLGGEFDQFFAKARKEGKEPLEAMVYALNEWDIDSDFDFDKEPTPKPKPTSDETQEQGEPDTGKTISIPFGYTAPQMKAGTKTQTARTKKYGEVGDTFTNQGTKYVLTEVFEKSMGAIEKEDFKVEGFDSPEALHAEFMKIKLRDDPSRMLWVHRFERVDAAKPAGKPKPKAKTKPDKEKTKRVAKSFLDKDNNPTTYSQEEFDAMVSKGETKDFKLTDEQIKDTQEWEQDSLFAMGKTNKLGEAHIAKEYQNQMGEDAHATFLADRIRYNEKLWRSVGGKGAIKWNLHGTPKDKFIRGDPKAYGDFIAMEVAKRNDWLRDDAKKPPGSGNKFQKYYEDIRDTARLTRTEMLATIKGDTKKAADAKASLAKLRERRKKERRLTVPTEEKGKEKVKGKPSVSDYFAIDALSKESYNQRFHDRVNMARNAGLTPQEIASQLHAKHMDLGDPSKNSKWKTPGKGETWKYMDRPFAAEVDHTNMTAYSYKKKVGDKVHHVINAKKDGSKKFFPYAKGALIQFTRPTRVDKDGKTVPGGFVLFEVTGDMKDLKNGKQAIELTKMSYFLDEKHMLSAVNNTLKNFRNRDVHIPGKEPAAGGEATTEGTPEATTEGTPKKTTPPGTEETETADEAEPETGGPFGGKPKKGAGHPTDDSGTDFKPGNQDFDADSPERTTIETLPEKYNYDTDPDAVEHEKNKDILAAVERPAVAGKEWEYTKGQIVALTKTEELLQKGKDKRGYLRVAGYAGTGKTTILSNVIERYLKLNASGNVVISAPTHKALINARERLGDLAKNKRVKFHTVQKLIYGAKKDAAGNKKIVYGLRNDGPFPAIVDGDLLVVDEASMMTGSKESAAPTYNADKEPGETNPNMLDHLRNHKGGMILFGDPFQLEPVITKKESGNTDPEVLQDAEVLLTDVKRQTKASRLLKYLTALRRLHSKRVITEGATTDPIADDSLEFVSEKQGLYGETVDKALAEAAKAKFKNKKGKSRKVPIQWISKLLGAVKEWKESGWSNDKSVVGVVKGNAARVALNRIIRGQLFGEDAGIVNPGEPLIVISNGKHWRNGETVNYDKKALPELKLTPEQEENLGFQFMNQAGNWITPKMDKGEWAILAGETVDEEGKTWATPAIVIEGYDKAAITNGLIKVNPNLDIDKVPALLKIFLRDRYDPNLQYIGRDGQPKTGGYVKGEYGIGLDIPKDKLKEDGDFSSDKLADSMTSLHVMTHGFVMTGHKSQGSQWKKSFVWLDNPSGFGFDKSGQWGPLGKEVEELRLNQTRWVYTALSRAEEKGYLATQMDPWMHSDLTGTEIDDIFVRNNFETPDPEGPAPKPKDPEAGLPPKDMPGTDGDYPGAGTFEAGMPRSKKKGKGVVRKDGEFYYNYIDENGNPQNFVLDQNNTVPIHEILDKIKTDKNLDRNQRLISKFLRDLSDPFSLTAKVFLVRKEDTVLGTYHGSAHAISLNTGRESKFDSLWRETPSLVNENRAVLFDASHKDGLKVFNHEATHAATVQALFDSLGHSASLELKPLARRNKAGGKVDEIAKNPRLRNRAILKGTERLYSYQKFWEKKHKSRSKTQDARDGAVADLIEAFFYARHILLKEDPATVTGYPEWATEKEIVRSDGTTVWTKHYGLTNLPEFIAELYTNPAFQKALAGIPTNLVDSLRSSRRLGDVLGQQDKLHEGVKPQNALDYIIRVLGRLLGFPMSWNNLFYKSFIDASALIASPRKSKDSHFIVGARAPPEAGMSYYNDRSDSIQNKMGFLDTIMDIGEVTNNTFLDKSRKAVFDLRHRAALGAVWMFPKSGGDLLVDDAGILLKSENFEERISNPTEAEQRELFKESMFNFTEALIDPEWVNDNFPILRDTNWQDYRGILQNRLRGATDIISQINELHNLLRDAVYDVSGFDTNDSLQERNLDLNLSTIVLRLAQLKGNLDEQYLSGLERETGVSDKRAKSRLGLGGLEHIPEDKKGLLRFLVPPKFDKKRAREAGAKKGSLLLSGGAVGFDHIWGRIARIFGLKTIHFDYETDLDNEYEARRILSGGVRQEIKTKGFMGMGGKVLKNPEFVGVEEALALHDDPKARLGMVAQWNAVYRNSIRAYNQFQHNNPDDGLPQYSLDKTYKSGPLEGTPVFRGPNFTQQRKYYRNYLQIAEADQVVAVVGSLTKSGIEDVGKNVELHSPEGFVQKDRETGKSIKAVSPFFQKQRVLGGSGFTIQQVITRDMMARVKAVNWEGEGPKFDSEGLPATKIQVFDQFDNKWYEGKWSFDDNDPSKFPVFEFVEMEDIPLLMNNAKIATIGTHDMGQITLRGREAVEHVFFKTFEGEVDDIGNIFGLGGVGRFDDIWASLVESILSENPQSIKQFLDETLKELKEATQRAESDFKTYSRSNALFKEEKGSKRPRPSKLEDLEKQTNLDWEKARNSGAAVKNLTIKIQALRGELDILSASSIFSMQEAVKLMATRPHSPKRTGVEKPILFHPLKGHRRVSGATFYAAFSFMENEIPGVPLKDIPQELRADAFRIQNFHVPDEATKGGSRPLEPGEDFTFQQLEDHNPVQIFRLAGQLEQWLDWTNRNMLAQGNVSRQVSAALTRTLTDQLWEYIETRYPSVAGIMTLDARLKALETAIKTEKDPEGLEGSIQDIEAIYNLRNRLQRARESGGWTPTQSYPDRHNIFTLALLGVKKALGLLDKTYKDQGYADGLDLDYENPRHRAVLELAGFQNPNQLADADKVDSGGFDPAAIRGMTQKEQKAHDKALEDAAKRKEEDRLVQRRKPSQWGSRFDMSSAFHSLLNSKFFHIDEVMDNLSYQGRNLTQEAKKLLKAQFTELYYSELKETFRERVDFKPNLEIDYNDYVEAAREAAAVVARVFDQYFDLDSGKLRNPIRKTIKAISETVEGRYAAMLKRQAETIKEYIENTTSDLREDLKPPPQDVIPPVYASTFEKPTEEQKKRGHGFISHEGGHTWYFGRYYDHHTSEWVFYRNRLDLSTKEAKLANQKLAAGEDMNKWLEVPAPYTEIWIWDAPSERLAQKRFLDKVLKKPAMGRFIRISSIYAGTKLMESTSGRDLTVVEMLALERAARQQGALLWNEDMYAKQLSGERILAELGLGDDEYLEAFAENPEHFRQLKMSIREHKDQKAQELYNKNYKDLTPAQQYSVDTVLPNFAKISSRAVIVNHMMRELRLKAFGPGAPHKTYGDLLIERKKIFTEEEKVKLPWDTTSEESLSESEQLANALRDTISAKEAEQALQLTPKDRIHEPAYDDPLYLKISGRLPEEFAGLDLEGELEALPPSRKTQGARLEIASPEMVQKYKEWENNRNKVLLRVIELTAFPADLGKGLDYSKIDWQRLDPRVASMLAEKVVKIGGVDYGTEEARLFNAKPYTEVARDAEGMQIMIESEDLHELLDYLANLEKYVRWFDANHVPVTLRTIATHLAIFGKTAAAGAHKIETEAVDPLTGEHIDVNDPFLDWESQSQQMMKELLEPVINVEALYKNLPKNATPQQIAEIVAKRIDEKESEWFVKEGLKKITTRLEQQGIFEVEAKDFALTHLGLGLVRMIINKTKNNWKRANITLRSVPSMFEYRTNFEEMPIEVFEHFLGELIRWNPNQKIATMTDPITNQEPSERYISSVSEVMRVLSGRPEGRGAEVHYTKGPQEFKYLSNFQELPEGVYVTHEGRKFKNVEAAYQAFKSGSYFDAVKALDNMSDKGGLEPKKWEDMDGMEAKKYSLHFGDTFTDSKVDTTNDQNIRLMELLLKERSLVDTAFMDLLRTTGKITHQAGGIWSKEFPRILTELNDTKNRIKDKRAMAELVHRIMSVQEEYMVDPDNPGKHIKVPVLDISADANPYDSILQAIQILGTENVNMQGVADFANKSRQETTDPDDYDNRQKEAGFAVAPEYILREEESAKRAQERREKILQGDSNKSHARLRTEKFMTDIVDQFFHVSAFSGKMMQDLHDRGMLKGMSNKEIDDLNMIQKIRLYFGKTGDELKQLYNEFEVGIMGHLNSIGGDSLQTFGDYVYARYSKTRDLYIRGKRKAAGLEVTDKSYSGMEHEEAQAIFEKYNNMSPEERQSLDKAVALFDRMNRRSLKMQLASGRLSQDEYHALYNAATDHKGRWVYAPLKGFEGAVEGQLLGKWHQSLLDSLRTEKKLRRIHKGFGEASALNILDYAFGRPESRANSKEILANGMRTVAEGIIKANKNEVRQSLHDSLVKMLNGPKELRDEYAKLIKIVDPEKKEDMKPYMRKKMISVVEWRTNPKTGKAQKLNVFREMEESTLDMENNVLVHRLNGKEVYMVFEGEQGSKLVRQMKNLDNESLGVHMQSLKGAMTWFAKAYTVFSPSFMVSNMMRDTLQAWFNLGNNEETKAFASSVLNFRQLQRNIRAMRAIAIRERKGEPVSADVEKKIAEAYEANAKSLDMSRFADDLEVVGQLFQAAGGRVSFFALEDVEARMQKITKGLDDAQRGKKFSKSTAMGMLHWMEDLNTGIENSVRLQVFREALKNGMSLERAAGLSRDVTVDFNRKGNKTNFLNTLYLFFNAGVQGNYRLFRAIISERSGKAAGIMLMKLVGYAAAYSLASRAFAGEDEETEENHVDRLSDYERDHQLQLWNPLLPGTGSHFKVHLPYGLNVVFSMGRRIADSMAYQWSDGRQGTSFVDSAMGFMENFPDVLNPLGSAGHPMITLVPHVARPLVNLNTVKLNFMGNPVYPQHVGFGPEVTDAYNHFSGVSPGSKAIAQGWAKFLGGDKYEKPFGNDWLTWSPETMDEMISFFFGSAGKQIWNGAGGLFGGDGWAGKDIPVYQALYKDKTLDFNMQSKYYELVEITDRIDKQVKAYKEGGYPKKAAEYMKLNKKYVLAKKHVDAYQKRERYWKRRLDKLDGARKQTLAKQSEKDLRKGKSHLIIKTNDLGIRL